MFCEISEPHLLSEGRGLALVAASRTSCPMAPICPGLDLCCDTPECFRCNLDGARPGERCFVMAL